MKINDKSFVIRSIYAPTKDEPAFFNSLFSVIANFSHTDLVLARDWNVVLNDTLDKDGGPPHVNRNLKEKIKSCMDFFNLRDIFRDFDPSKIYLREFKPSPTRRHDWIFLISDNLYRNFKSVDISQSIMFDYKIATFFLDNELTKRGSGYWTINNSILNDIVYTKIIKRVINDFLITNYITTHIVGNFKMCISRRNNQVLRSTKKEPK